jgi:fructuronate reductase
VNAAHRLSEATLGLVEAARPGYDRSPPPTIVHLGVGAFARAHLGVYADDLLRAGWPATIRGVSLRGPGAEERLAPQDGLYSVTEREPGEVGPTRIVGSFTAVGTGPALAVEAVAAPGTTLVTLTVTEKGYEVADGELLGTSVPQSAPGVLAVGLAARRAMGAPAPTVVSLDNLSENGRVLRDAVLEVAGRIDATLPGWIRDEVRFPSSVVDRMVPATTEADVADVARRLGVVDLAAVTAERHRSWVLEGADGLPPLDEVGVEVVTDVEAFQRRKLWLLNGPHSALAYAGLLVGCPTIADAATHPLVAPFVRRLVDDTLEVADLPGALAPRRFADDVLTRFENPLLGHTCAQVGADGSRKLAQRLLPVAAGRRDRGLPNGRLALVAATWIAAAAGIAVDGRQLPMVEDPSAVAYRAAGADLRRVVEVALDGRTDGGFAGEVASMLQRLVRDGRRLLAELS